jgi:hypothetical protein
MKKVSELRDRELSSRWQPYGSNPTITMEPEKLIRGRVTDQNGKPQVGVEVTFPRTTLDDLTTNYDLVKTDENGNYEFRGIAKHKSYLMNFAPPIPSGLMFCQVLVEDTPGFEPLTINAKCAKGVLVSGTVTNKVTGKPIPFADLTIAPLSKNPFVPRYPMFLHGRYSGSPQNWADEQGRFQLVTIPGPVVLMVRTTDDRFDFSPAVPDPDYPQYFKESESTILYKGYRNSDEHLQGCWCKVLNAKSADETLTMNIELMPSTKTLVKAVDADGKPLQGCKATGVQHIEFARPTEFRDTDTLTVVNLDRKKERLLAVIHPNRKLVGTLKMNADTKDLVVKLDAGGCMIGKVVSKSGKPISGVNVTPRFVHRQATEAYAEMTRQSESITNAKGEFRLDGLFPGQEFELQFSLNESGRRLPLDQSQSYTIEKHGATVTLKEIKLKVDDKKE